jgi:hypothetical protein
MMIMKISDMQINIYFNSAKLMQPKYFCIYAINLLSHWYSAFLHTCSPFPLYSGEIFCFVSYRNYSYFQENGLNVSVKKLNFQAHSTA